MYNLKAEIRDMKVKAKRLRNEGKIPATIYGKNLEEPILLQIEKADVNHFYSKLSKGNTLKINTGKDSYDVLFKEIALEPISQNVEHIEFQNLVVGDTMNTVSKVIVQNKDNNKNNISLHTEEIPYSSEPKYFVSEVVIDVENLEAGTTITLGDLDISKNENLKLTLPDDTLILSVDEPVVMTDEEIENLEAGENNEEAAEPEVIGEEKTEK